MLLALPRFSVFSLLFLLIISLLTFITGAILSSGTVIKTKLKRIFFAGSIISLIVIVLSFFKYTFIQKSFFENLTHQIPEPHEFIFIIGISYSSFKMINFIIESYKQQVSKINFLNYINFIFFFPAFISGPIDRYNHFCTQMELKNARSIKDDLIIGVERIIHGLFKKFVLATIVFPYTILNLYNSVVNLNIWEIILGLYAYTLYIYFDFAGYSDIAIGSAKIMGIKIPENFNNPFFKKNIRQLWTNWHITLTGWLTDYIYWPLSRKLRNIEFFRKNPIFLSNISIIVTFIIVGMWHGETINFVIWGFYHGVGLAFLNIYQKQKRKIKNQQMRKYFKSKYSHWIGVTVTFNYFAFGILLFSMRMDEITELMSRFL